MKEYIICDLDLNGSGWGYEHSVPQEEFVDKLSNS